MKSATLVELDLHNNPLTPECHHELLQLQHPKINLLLDHYEESVKLESFKVIETFNSTDEQSDELQMTENGSSDQNSTKSESFINLGGPAPPAPPPPNKMPPPPPPPGKRFQSRK